MVVLIVIMMNKFTKFMQSIFGQKAKLWRIIGIIGIVLALVMIFNAAGAFNGIKSKARETFLDKYRNPENIIDVSRPEYKEIAGTANGITVTVNKDGTIVLNGRATSDITLVLNEIADLTDGELITIGKTKVDGAAVGITDDEAVLLGKSTKDTNKTMVLGTAESYNIVLIIEENAAFNNVTIMPAVSSGTEVIDYYTVE